jgi:L-alanine-DL-glutamate epimerase-like enolase superfamily enzyme
MIDLEITDLSVQLVRWPQVEGRHSTLGVVRVDTNEGVVGHSFLGTTWRGAHFDTPYLMEIVKPVLLGRNPLDSGAIWQEIRHARRVLSELSVGAE